MAKISFADYFTKAHAQHLTMAISCNVPDGDPSPTDQSMIDILERAGVDMKALKEKHCKPNEMIRFPFSSNRKRMSTIVPQGMG